MWTAASAAHDEAMNNPMTYEMIQHRHHELMEEAAHARFARGLRRVRLSSRFHNH